MVLLSVALLRLELLSPHEMALLKQALPLNVNVDNAPFRQQLQAHLKTVLVRVRDGSFVALKELKTKTSPKKNKDKKHQPTQDELRANVAEQLGDMSNGLGRQLLGIVLYFCYARFKIFCSLRRLVVAVVLLEPASVRELPAPQDESRVDANRARCSDAPTQHDPAQRPLSR